MNKIIIFDLDDTLYKEIDFLKSAFKEIVEYALVSTNRPDLIVKDVYAGMLDTYFSKMDAFDYLIASVGGELDKTILLKIYRNHLPYISLSGSASDLLKEIQNRGFEIGIITDGRSVQQRNKIRALGLNEIVKDENIIISGEFGLEKPNSANYEYFVNKYPEATEFYYIADNPRKDFLTPNALGWKTICLKDDGRNIHKQHMDLPQEYLPQVVVHSLGDVIAMI